MHIRKKLQSVFSIISYHDAKINYFLVFIKNFYNLFLQNMKRTNKSHLYDNEIFITKANLKHKNKYDYSQVKYINSLTKVQIKCKIHGIFEQRPDGHLSGKGCPQCGFNTTHNKRTKNNENFILNANFVHLNGYNYDKVIYKKSQDKVIITCLKHGDFTQKACSHLRGQGCPKCGCNNIAENRLLNKIIKYYPNLEIISQYKPIWLKGRTGTQSLDIYIPDFNIAIEYQGIQHFKPIEFFGGEKHFKYIEELDRRKNCLCEENGCKLYYFTYNSNHIPNDYPFLVYTNETQLLKNF